MSEETNKNFPQVIGRHLRDLKRAGQITVHRVNSEPRLTDHYRATDFIVAPTQPLTTLDRHTMQAFMESLAPFPPDSRRAFRYAGSFWHEPIGERRVLNMGFLTYREKIGVEKYIRQTILSDGQVVQTSPIRQEPDKDVYALTRIRPYPTPTIAGLIARYERGIYTGNIAADRALQTLRLELSDEEINDIQAANFPLPKLHRLRGPKDQKAALGRVQCLNTIVNDDYTQIANLSLTNLLKWNTPTSTLSVK